MVPESTCVPDLGVQPSSGGCWVRHWAVGAAAWRKGSTAPRGRGHHVRPLPWAVDLPATVLSYSVCLVAQFVSVFDPMDYSLQAPLSIGILQARILEWAAVPFSRSEEAHV